MLLDGQRDRERGQDVAMVWFSVLDLKEAPEGDSKIWSDFYPERNDGQCDRGEGFEFS